MRSGSVRASSMSTSARAPKVHHVFTPLISQPPSVLVAVTLMPATSEPKSGSVTATAFITSAVASLGSHSCFCSSVPPFSSARVRISGRVMSEPPAPSEPRRQLLGGDDHADVLGLAAAAVAAVLLGDRQAEGAHLGRGR